MTFDHADGPFEPFKLVCHGVHRRCKSSARLASIGLRPPWLSQTDRMQTQCRHVCVIVRGRLRCDPLSYTTNQLAVLCPGNARMNPPPARAPPLSQRRGGRVRGRSRHQIRSGRAARRQR
jgi:hypothetical protein